MMPLFKLLAACKGVRGTVLDVFGKTAERRMERALLADYETMVLQMLTPLRADQLPLAVELANLPAQVRGFGHVKAAAVSEYETKKSALWTRWQASGATS